MCGMWQACLRDIGKNHSEMDAEIRLEVLICTLGTEGIGRVARASHPRVGGVRYIVSWQLPDMMQGTVPEVPDTLAGRADFTILPHDSRGLSVNRNYALAHASAPLVLISDDDVDYTAEGLSAVIREFDERPDHDLLAFRFASAGFPKTYPPSGFDLRHPARGYYVTSFEIGIRLGERTSRLRFNEHFGIGADFGSGEESLLVDSALREGLRCAYVPVVICSHDGSTTACRDADSEDFVAAKGAVVSRLHPLGWPLRMLAHMWRDAGGGRLRRGRYLRAWLGGVRKARRLNAFSS